jgi:8-oxo-dGTP pyrophosphatase MutT (NUDIX family)
MYKVFFNDRRISLTDNRNITYKPPLELVENLNSQKDVKNWFLNFINSNLKDVLIFHPNIDEFFSKLFTPAFKMIYAAGGVVFKKGKMLVIFRNEKWDLPKGKIDKGESAEAAAIREVQEECGINRLEIVKELPSTFHIYQSPHKNSQGRWILKETFWFEMNYSGKGNGKPRTEENISEVRWMGKSELDEIISNTYENLKPVFMSYRD